VEVQTIQVEVLEVQVLVAPVVQVDHHIAEVQVEEDNTKREFELPFFLFLKIS